MEVWIPSSKLVISGIITFRNPLSLGYPFLETILHLLPAVDELLVGDGGSTDDTLRWIKELQGVFPKVKLFKTPWYKSEHWESFDDAVNLLISKMSGTWIWEIMSDEFWHEKDLMKLRSLVRTLDNKKYYNSIRQVCRGYGWTDSDTYEYRNIRILKKLPNLVSHWGGDDFQIAPCVSPREGLTSHNVPPEYDLKGIEMYHMSRLFPKSRAAQDEVNVKFCGTSKKSTRWETYEITKEVNWGDYKPPPIKDVMLNLPALILGLSQETEYHVREELFDKSWLEKTTGLRYN